VPAGKGFMRSKEGNIDVHEKTFLDKVKYIFGHKERKGYSVS
jgi:hypothetical protein